MSEWRGYKLGEIIEIIGGGTPKTTEPKYWNGNIPWLSVVDFNKGKKFVYETEKYISIEGLKNCSTKLLSKGDIIISARGTVGVVAVLGREMAFNQSCYGIKPLSLVDKEYLYYLLISSIQKLKYNSHGGVFDTITRETFNTIEVLLPSLEEQKRIASILSSLDDKIDLLYRENKTLEAIAETLFRKWFVEDAKEEWEIKTLYDCISIVGGGTPKVSNETYWNGNICWIACGDISENHKGYIIKTAKKITIEGLNNSSAKLLPENALVISARGTVGKYSLLSKPMAFSQSNYGVLPKEHGCFFFTYLLVSYCVDELQSAAYGSVFDAITTCTFKGINIFVPSVDEIIIFENQVKKYFDKIKLNAEQIKRLTTMKDMLLVKLMSK